MRQDIPGTTLFDGDQAQQGYALNRMWEFDHFCMDKIVGNPEELTRYSINQLVELAGAQGVELLNWVAMRGALTGRVGLAHSNYHIPISNTAAATMVLENRPLAGLKAA